MTTAVNTADAHPLASDFPAANDDAWRALVDKALKGEDFRKRLVARTADGVEIEPLYTRPATSTGEYPGIAPFTRGTASRLETRRWLIGQIRTETSADALAAAVRDDIEGGADAITIRLAAPGQSGLPADPAALTALFGSLPGDASIRLSFAPGAIDPAAAEALARWSRSPPAGVTVAALGLDPLGALAATGVATFLAPRSQSFAAPIPWLDGPATTLVADARPYHDAGASEAQEIACLAATLVAYLRAAETTGKSPASALPAIGLAMATDADLFLGLAKLRATRRVVHRIADACGAGAAVARMPLAVTTSARMMARRDPWVNMLRVTTAATSAAIGGADEITVLPYTWALGAPDALANRIARNVGLVLREEAGLARIADPAGGAWALEALTNDLGAKAWAIFQRIEASGGMAHALASGLIADEIAAVAKARAADVARRRIELTGVSAFPRLGNDGVAVSPWPEPPALPSSPAMKPLRPVRLAAQFEALRVRADALPNLPKVFLATLGPLGEHGPRATWIGNLLACAGIETLQPGAITASGEAGRLFAESGANAAVVCGSDDTYANLAEATVMALKSAGAKAVWLAGRPGGLADGLNAAGLDGSLQAGADVVKALTKVLDALAQGTTPART